MSALDTLEFSACLTRAGLTRTFDKVRRPCYKVVQGGDKLAYARVLWLAREHWPKDFDKPEPWLWKKAMAWEIWAWCAQNRKGIIHRFPNWAPKMDARNGEIRRLAVQERLGTAAIAAEVGLSAGHVRKVLRRLGCEYKRKKGRWAYDDGKVLTSGKRRLTAHRKAHRAAHRGAGVAVSASIVPFGTVDSVTATLVKTGVILMVGQKRWAGTVAVPVVPEGTLGHMGYGELRSYNGPALPPPSKIEIVNGYPALTWDCGLYSFLHTRNYMMARGVIAMPYDGERSVVHHVDADKENAHPRNLVLLTEREHLALHSHSRKG